MQNDKSQKERDILTRKIIDIEDKENDLLRLKRQHEEQLNSFASDIQRLTFETNDILYGSASEVHLNYDELEYNQQIQNQLMQYVDQEQAELDEKVHKIRQKMDDERDKLYEERNRLPWE